MERPGTKMQKEKSNLGKCSKIKSKYLLSSSKVEMFIKIAFVGVWCWGEKLLVIRAPGCCLKIRTQLEGVFDL